MQKQVIFIVFLLFISGCSGFKQSEHKKLRNHNTTLLPLAELKPPPFSVPESEPTCAPSYPWDKKWIGSHLRIHQEFFRCKGSATHPAIEINGKRYEDCLGIDSHGLPAKEKKPFIYPILIDLLNHIQEVTMNKAIITCGHRCPRHNTYADCSRRNRTSKHQIGAEVDFYVQGMEDKPHQVVAILLDYYKNKGTHPHECYFSRCAHLNTRTPSWVNREVRITLSEADERRDRDNQHFYPYLTIEVIYDKATNRPVSYSWHQAHYNYFKT